MQSLNNYVSLKYTSTEYKYQQLLLIPKDELCIFSQSSIQDLFEKNINKGFPHVLALVQDTAKGQDVYDADLLGEYLAKNDRWKWLNPATQKNIQKIEYFVIEKISDGYKLIKEINNEQTATEKPYEDLWFCNNLAAASNPDNPYAFQAMRAMSLHYFFKKDYQKIKEVKHNCFQLIKNHYGTGAALLSIPNMLNPDYYALDKILFYPFNYDFLNDYFKESPLEKLINDQGIEFFNLENIEKNQELYYSKLEQTHSRNLENNLNDFVKILNLLLVGNIPKDILQPFLSYPDINVVCLTQAILCTMGDTNRDYIQNLIEYYPKWQLGKAYELSEQIKKEKNIQITFIDKLIDLSSTSSDPLLLELTALIFERLEIKSPTWKNIQNIYMRILGISRFNIPIVNKFTETLEENELENSLSLLSTNYQLTKSYSSLLKLSNQQIAIGIKNKKKALYDEGIEKGIRIFDSKGKHNLLTYSIGSTLIQEITPYKSTKSLECIGVNALKYTLRDNPSNPHAIAKMNLAEYFIRKGTVSRAKKGHQWLLELKSKFPNDITLDYYFIRYALRFAKNEEDFNHIEAQLAKINKKTNKLPLFYLLKALWHAHPLKQNHPEWYILASQNLIKAFKDADQSDVDILIKNLHRFDKLTEEDQIKCKIKILCLLGHEQSIDE